MPVSEETRERIVKWAAKLTAPEKARAALNKIPAATTLRKVGKTVPNLPGKSRK